MRYNIGVIAGDGIGPEITAEAVKVLNAAGQKFDFELNYTPIDMGGCSIDKYGVPLTQEAVEKAKAGDAVLMGSIGGDAKTSPWYQLPPEKRPEAGLLGIRRALGLFANLRPAFLYEELRGACPLKDEISCRGIDLVMVRELTGGLYFGARKTVTENGVAKAVDTLEYSETEIRRVAVKAFDIAMKRRKNVISVDKANVLDSSRLWRKTVEDVAKDYPEVECNNLYVDNCAMQIAVKPTQFDVIVTGNLFGDILSDEAAVVGGSIGMLPSASIGECTSLYEPIHGSAPDIAGKGIANPIGTILSAAMLLRYSLHEEAAADAIEAAVDKALAEGYRTPDLWKDGFTKVNTSEMTKIISERV